MKAEGAFKDAVEQPRTQLDKTTAAAKLILEEEARERAAKGERLKASRAARDAAVDDVEVADLLALLAQHRPGELQRSHGPHRTRFGSVRGGPAARTGRRPVPRRR